MSQRLRPRQRIRRGRLYEIIHKKGKFSRGVFLNVWSCEDAEVVGDSREAKIGIIVTRKTSLRATRRNLWKRRIREGFRKLQGDVREGVAVMVQSRPALEAPTAAEVYREMRQLLGKLGSLR